MGETKEAIMMAALQLFARDGYEAVSVSQIAGALGMTKGALYKHYKNKRDIFDHIVARMEQLDRERAEAYAVPAEPLEQIEKGYPQVSMEQLIAYSVAQFQYWTEHPFAAPFRNMLVLEQFRSAEMQQLYQQYLVAGPADYVADLFEAAGMPNAKEQANCFYGVMFFFYSKYDGAANGTELADQLRLALEYLVESARKGNDAE